SFKKCHYKSWKQFLDGVKGAPTGRKLKKINDFMNKARYIVDPINWGVKDYWETPGQFFNRYGNCEDYTIAKYLSLRVSTAEQKWATEAA
ncbi:MAG: transglutaminase-like cysteine peptidase, partial [Verrucomicrobiota bacterium]|nr:transglutaminase-like cysteine peptidase [Verrucomicrobiota bacterium]